MNRFRHLTLPLLLGSLVCSGYILPKDRRYADYLLKLEVAAISRMHAFRLVSSSAQVGQERLEKIDLRFSHHRILSQEEARALVVEVAEYLVKRMNSDTALKEKGFLSSPFDLHQLHLEIEMDNLISMNIDTLTIQRVILDNRSITYQTFKGSNLLYSRSSTFHETFQDALISLGRETTFDPSLDSENDRAIIEQDLGSDALYEKSALFTFSALELQEEPKTAESALSPSANEASEEDSVIHAIEASISPASGISSEEEDSPITNFGVESEPLQDSEELGSSLQPIITSVDTSSEQLSSQTNTEEAYHAQIEERIDAQLLDEEKKPDIAPTAEYGIIDDPSVAEEIDHEALIEEPQSPSFFTKIWQKLFREPISTSEPESEEKPVKDEVTTDEVSLETLEHNIPAQYTIAAVQHEELQSPSFFAKAWNTLFGEPEEVIVEETTSPSELKAIAAVVEDEISKADAILLSLEHEIAVQKKIEEEMAEESKTSPIDPELVIQDPLQEDIDIAEEDVDLLEKNRAESPSFFTKIWNKIFGEPEEVIVVQEIVKEPVSPTELESDKTAQSDELFSVTLEDSPKIIPDEAPQSPSFFSKVWNKVVGEPVSIDKIESDRADAIFAPLENESPAEALEASDAIIIQNGPETIQDEELQSPSFFTKVWNKVFGEPVSIDKIESDRADAI
ncbi:MAG: hypothetical protein QRY74_02410, partial [Chlamydia sp.]